MAHINLTRRSFLRLATLGVGTAALAACKPEVVEVTRVVKETIQVEKEKVVEKQVEVTKVVEKKVEVTKVVEKEKEVQKIVTATPVAPPNIEKLTAPALKAAPAPAVHLTMWDAWGRTVYFGREPIQESVDAWNQANPSATCEYLPGLAEMQAKILTSVASGDPPNVVIVGPPTQWAYRGIYTKLDDYLALGGHEFLKDEMYPGCWSSQIVNGGIYSIAWNTNNGCLFYNTDLFKAAGLDPDKPPKTIDELTQYADKLTVKKSDGTLTQLGFVPWFNIAGIFGTWASAFGAQLWDEAARKIKFDDPKSIESLKWQVSFATKYGYDKIAAFNDSLAGQDPLGSGKLAILFTGPWMLNAYRSDYPALNWRAAPPPMAPGGPKGGTWLGGRWVGIPKGAKNADLTWEFNKFFSGRASQKLYGVLTTNFSVFIKDNDNKWFNADKELKTFVNDLPNCWPIPMIPTSDHAFWTALNPMIEEALRGKRTPEDAMKEATRLAQDEVDKFFKSIGT